MEGLNEFVSIFGNGFFPVVVCGVLFWFVYTKDKAHRDEVNELRKTVESNTVAVTKLTDIIQSQSQKE